MIEIRGKIFIERFISSCYNIDDIDIQGVSDKRDRLDICFILRSYEKPSQDQDEVELFQGTRVTVKRMNLFSSSFLLQDFMVTGIFFKQNSFYICIFFTIVGVLFFI